MRMEKKLKLVKGVSNSPLKKMNEGVELKNPDKYVFQGVFTQCSTPEHKVINRNGRIYMEKEVLRHLGYLRDMIKDNNGCILGELDHPEGRFDVQMKEASHKITDLWYDDKTKCVMGRIEVLDTPNGKTLKELINAGFPLYVSSRAAGDVDERTKEVEIAQIFTYDVVCTPGFKEARLERVNESLMSNKTLKYINESMSSEQTANLKDITVPVSAINESIERFKNTKVTDVLKPLLEEDESDKKEDEEKELNDMSKFLPIAGGNEELKEEDEAADSKEEKSEGAESEEKDSDEDKDSDDDKESEEKTELSDEEKEENRKLIIDVVGVDADGDAVKDEETEEESSDDEEKEEKSEDEKESEEEKSEDGKESEEESSEDAEATEEACQIKEKKEKIKENTDKDIAELESILDSVQKAESVKESIIRRYPFAISLSESNFSKFASLRPKLKKRCSDFIEEHQIYDIQAINELWTTPLREEKKCQDTWLQLASQSDIDLFVAAPLEVQNAIEESAKYVVLETQEDVDEFWARTGLRQAAARNIMNEKLVGDYNKLMQEQAKYSEKNPLGYSMDWISMTESMFE